MSHTLDQPRRVIVIDDNPAIHDDFRKTLVQAHDDSLEDAERALFGDTNEPATPALRFEIDTASQGQDGLAAVQLALEQGRPYQLAFVDMRMPPGWDGVQTITRLWEVDPSLQVVICTAYSDYSWNQIVDTLGVSDRLLILKKPFDAAEVCQLATTLTEKWLLTRQAKLKLSELESLVEARTADLRNAALHDKLTGLPNRAHCIERLSRTMALASRDPSRHYAVLFLDFDGFKSVNDTLGHTTGDLLLQAIATRLTQTLRDTDTVSRAATPTAARLGGDEFIVLLEGLSRPMDAAAVADRVLHELGRPYELKGHLISSSVSIGIACGHAGYDTPEEILRDADTAMYHAKASGKAQYVVFDPAMHEQAVNRISMQRDLRHAVEQKLLHLVYQPIVSLATQEIVGFEALVRWQHPNRGSISPLEFVKLAEETTLIHTMGEWVLRTAVAAWAPMLSPDSDRPITLSINLSRRQLTSPKIVDILREALDEYRIDPKRLRLEITESCIIDDDSTAMSTLQAIRDIGVELDVDDFGTGYSSLSCLHKFPISGLKIDRSFVASIGERRDFAAVVQAIITLARNLGIEVIAEGIESRDQAALLHSMGVELAQGFLFAHPCRFEDARALLDRPVALAA